MNDFPLLIEFVSNTQLYRERQVVPKLPIVQNCSTQKHDCGELEAAVSSAFAQESVPCKRS